MRSPLAGRSVELHFYQRGVRVAGFLVMGLLATVLFEGTARAGLLVPWHDRGAVRARDLNFESEPSSVVRESTFTSAEPIAEDCSNRPLCEVGGRGAQVPGGCQAPVVAQGGQHSFLGLSHASYGDLRILTPSHFSYLRQVVIQLPMAPRSELLDPPE